ncbi:MAG: hypothetical protein AB7P20_06270 [Rhizobiaceae bacterium]
MKGMLSIFRKAEVAKVADTPQDRLAAALAPPPVALAPVVAPPVVADLPPAKLVFGIDATASRAHALAASTALTQEVLSALPGRLQVALAVHGGGELHTFTRFETDAAKLRARIAAMRCRAGVTCLLDILERTLKTEAQTIVYIGDVFEESERQALKLAAALARRNTRLIILHDTGLPGDPPQTGIFAEMAALTGGCVLPFDASALPTLRELLSAVAVLAVGGTELLAAKQEAMPAARLLLQHLKET